MDDTGDGRWLTYSELATIRGINRASAVKLVQRERWPRSTGNERSRIVRVLVPDEWLAPAKETLADTPMDPGMSREDTGILPALIARADRAEGRADEAHKRADVAIALAEQTLARLDEVTNKADRLRDERDDAEARAKGAETAQAEAEAEAAELRDQLDQTRVQAEALQEAVELKAAAEAAGRGGRWERLRRAWRGE